jgi:hypothetical protein
MHTLRKYIFLPFVIAAFGCNTQKNAMMDAQKYADSGLYQEAFNKYLSIYQESKSTDAHIALASVAQTISNKNFSEAQLLAGRGNFESAIDALDKAEAFVFEHQWLGLTMPFYAESLRSDCRSNIAAQYYSKAEEAARNDRYADAKMYLEKVFRNQPNHEEAKYLQRVLSFLPTYKKGLKAMELGLYREAYLYFDVVADKDADFGDVLTLLKECKDKASFTLSYLTLPSQMAPAALEQAISTSVKQEILACKNPFIKLVSRDQLDVIISEQQNAMSASFDQNKIVEAGKLLGADFIIVGEVISFNNNQPEPQVVNKMGFLGKTRLARKVQYQEVYVDNSFSIIYRYHLMDAETGEVVAAENIPFNYKNELHYAQYSGDSSNLYPIDPSETGDVFQDLIYPSEQGKRVLDELLSAPRLRLTEAEQITMFLEFIGHEIADKVNEFAMTK